MSSKDEQGHRPLPSHLWAWHSLCFSSKGVVEVPVSLTPDVAGRDYALANSTSGKQDDREAVPPPELALKYRLWGCVSFLPSFHAVQVCMYLCELKLLGQGYHVSGADGLKSPCPERVFLHWWTCLTTSLLKHNKPLMCWKLISKYPRATETVSACSQEWSWVGGAPTREKTQTFVCMFDHKIFTSALLCMFISQEHLKLLRNLHLVQQEDWYNAARLVFFSFLSLFDTFNVSFVVWQWHNDMSGCFHLHLWYHLLSKQYQIHLAIIFIFKHVPAVREHPKGAPAVPPGRSPRAQWLREQQRVPHLLNPRHLLLQSVFQLKPRANRVSRPKLPSHRVFIQEDLKRKEKILLPPKTQ